MSIPSIPSIPSSPILLAGFPRQPGPGPGCTGPGGTGGKDSVPIGTQITILSLLGRGAYGSVYSCRDEFGASLAIKCIESDGHGIPCLMETSIMSVIHHPCLQRALSVYASPKMVYIISDLARCDLSTYTREHIVPPDILRSWAFSLLQGLACLHRKDIIHGDVKASNILLFDQDRVRLTDFTLSVRKWDGQQNTYNHTICTVTHRPLEVWLNREWDTSVDIWSLGCTLYEIAYGSTLFPYQGINETDSQGTLLRERSVNCLLDWAEKGPAGKQDCPISRANLRDYTTFTLKDRFWHPEYAEFNSLILSMLKIDPNERPSAVKLLASPYFTEDKTLTMSPFMIISTPVTTLSDREIQQLEQLLRKFTTISSVIQFTIELYSRTLGLSVTKKSTSSGSNGSYLKLMSCYWIAMKLILRKTTSLDLPMPDILAMERNICFHLSFRLHAPSNNNLYLSKP